MNFNKLIRLDRTTTGITFSEPIPMDGVGRVYRAEIHECRTWLGITGISTEDSSFFCYSTSKVYWRFDTAHGDYVSKKLDLLINTAIFRQEYETARTLEAFNRIKG